MGCASPGAAPAQHHLCGRVHTVPLQGHMAIQKGGRPCACADGIALALEWGRLLLLSGHFESMGRTRKTAQDGWVASN